jgi:hypothetical protein
MTTNPIDGDLGSLTAFGWIAETPTGHDEAFLLLTTPDPRAPHTMAAIADLLGLPAGADIDILDTVTAQVGADGWLTLHVGPDRLERPVDRPVDAEWTQTAHARGRLVLVIGTAPMPAGMDPDQYTDRHGSECRLGLVPLT